MQTTLPRFKLLDAAISEDLELWRQLWQIWPQREVFAHPSYAKLFASPSDRVMCAAMQTDNGGILFPFLMQSLMREPWSESHETIFDLVSPYGYGGPFAWNCTENDAKDFWRAFLSWGNTQKVISSFIRLHLFDEQLLALPCEIISDRMNIVRSLEQTPEEIWHDFEHKVRKNVSRAKSSNLSVEIDLNGRRLDDFLSIYYSTMDRRDADKAYYFPRDFFESIVSQLIGQFAFFFTLCRDKIVSTELVLISADHIYSFLGGTLTEAFHQRPNDYLKYEIILWGQRTGKKAYILGGGYGGDDGIFRYKKSFAPNGARPFYVGRQIFDAITYNRLIHQRRVFEESHGKAWMPNPAYFPAYRA
jgi:hypothetical protein